MTKQDIIDYVMETPRNTNKAVLNSMLNELSNGTDEDTNNGDFSIATLTLIDFPDNFMMYCPNILEYAELNIAWSMPYTGGVNAIPIILYKGKAAVIGTVKSHVKSISGNIEYNESFQLYIISGDCSMTWDTGEGE